MQNSIDTEQDILIKLSAKDRVTTERIYRQHCRIMTAWIVKRGGNEDDAIDICQEAMIILYEKSLDRSFSLSCKVGTYLFAVSKNLWYKKLQHKPATLNDWTEGLEEQIEDSYEADIKAHEEREMHYKQLDNALDMLGEPCSKILKAYYYGNRSMQQIADDFNYTNADNAKTQKYKCLTRLKKIFYNTKVS